MEPLISFLTFYITDPSYTSILIIVASLVLGKQNDHSPFLSSPLLALPFAICFLMVIRRTNGVDLYADQVGKSSVIDSQLIKLRQCLDKEIEMQKNVFSVLGMVDSIVSNSTK